MNSQQYLPQQGNQPKERTLITKIKNQKSKIKNQKS